MTSRTTGTPVRCPAAVSDAFVSSAVVSSAFVSGAALLKGDLLKGELAVTPGVSPWGHASVAGNVDAYRTRVMPDVDNFIASTNATGAAVAKQGAPPREEPR